MIAVDTNILVRLLTNDDVTQAQLAAEIMRQDDVFLVKTVILETEWVLRYAYGLDRSAILDAFKKLLGLENILVEEPLTIRQALAWYEQGADFADALHVASCDQADKFFTFDRTLSNKIGSLAGVKIQLLN